MLQGKIQELYNVLKGYTVTQVGVVDSNTFIIVGSYNFDFETEDTSAPSSRVISVNTTILNVGYVEYHGAHSRGVIAGGIVNGKKQAHVISQPVPAVTFFSYASGFNDFEGVIVGVAVAESIKLINGSFYIAASNREIYKKLSPNNWELITSELHNKGEIYPSALAIDAFSETDIYFSGEKGELWHFNGNKWENLDPPCNWDMAYLICAKDKKVYVGGEQGQLLIGRDNHWEEIIPYRKALKEYGKMTSMTEFKGKIYMVDRFHLNYLMDGKWVQEDKVSTGIGTESIDANEDLMIIGCANEIILFDGENEEYLYSNNS